MAGWQPTSFERFDSCIEGSSMRTARVMTDAGPAYLKALGNPEGPHALARELVGTALAQWFGLPTLDFALLEIDSDLDEIEFPNGTFAQSGSAFVTRSEKGTTWGGDARTLRRLENPDDVAGLVVFDTWIRNRDRHAPESMERDPNYNNVFLSKENTERRRLRLLAIDHTHCFATGDLSARIAKISNVRDPEIYGLFPGFRENLRVRKDAVTRAAGRLANVDRNVLKSIIGRIPQDWDVTNAAKNALEEFLYRRAEFVGSNIVETLTPMLWPQQDLPFPADNEDDE